MCLTHLMKLMRAWYERLKTILDKKQLASAKLDEIKKKINILAQFAEKKAEEAEEAVESAVHEEL